MNTKENCGVVLITFSTLELTHFDWPNLGTDCCPDTRLWASPSPLCTMSRHCHCWGRLLRCIQQTWLGGLSRNGQWSLGCSHGSLQLPHWLCLLILKCLTTGKEKAFFLIGRRCLTKSSAIWSCWFSQHTADCISCRKNSHDDLVILVAVLIYLHIEHLEWLHASVPEIIFDRPFNLFLQKRD